MKTLCCVKLDREIWDNNISGIRVENIEEACKREDARTWCGRPVQEALEQSGLVWSTLDAALLDVTRASEPGTKRGVCSDCAARLVIALSS